MSLHPFIPTSFLSGIQQSPAAFAISFLSYAVVGSITFLVICAVYRITLHPLAKYPGPFLAKVTDFYGFYYAWRGDAGYHVLELHEKYGPVVRAGPNSLVFNTSTALQFIYGNAGKNRIRKSEFYSVWPAVRGAWNTQNAIDKNIHSRKRRVLSHAFSTQALRAMEEQMLPQIRKFCDLLTSKTTWNVSNLADAISFDIMGDLCFGRSFDMLETDGENPVEDSILKSGARSYALGQYPLLHRLGFIEKFFMGDIMRHRMEFVKYARREANNRMALKSERKDFFHYLINAKDPETGEGFSKPELWSEAGLLIVAGSDTSSTALTALFYNLSQRPEIVAKLLKELRAAFPGGVEEIFGGPTLNSCVYLRACVDEALRISPPIRAALPRCVEIGVAVIDGHAIPAGIDVAVGCYAIHHNPEYYPNPSVYQPERWLTTSTSKSPSGSASDSSASSSEDDQEQMSAVQAAFCPFSLGPRGCIGKGMAYLELLTTVARTVYLCEMKMVDKTDGVKRAPRENIGWTGRGDELLLKDCFVSEKRGPLVQFKLREDVKA